MNNLLYLNKKTYPDKCFFLISPRNTCVLNIRSTSSNIFSYFSTKTYVVSSHSKRLIEALRMNTQTRVFVLKYETYRYLCLDDITKTCLYNTDLLKPHFCVVKLGFTGIYISFFLIFAQKHRLWVLVRTAFFFIYFYLFWYNFQCI